MQAYKSIEVGMLRSMLLTQNGKPTFALFPTAINFFIAGGDEIFAARKVQNRSQNAERKP